jgi:hypothetical protein
MEDIMSGAGRDDERDLTERLLMEERARIPLLEAENGIMSMAGAHERLYGSSSRRTDAAPRPRIRPGFRSRRGDSTSLSRKDSFESATTASVSTYRSPSARLPPSVSC